MNKLLNDPRGFAASSEFRGIMRKALDGSTELTEVKELISSFIRIAEEAPDGLKKDIATVSLSSIFHITATRAEKDELISYVQPLIKGWNGVLLRKLMISHDAGPRKQAMMEVLRRNMPKNELQPLLDSRNRKIANWAAQIMSNNEPDYHASIREHPQSFFKSQTDQMGNPLDDNATRYLDQIVWDIHESTVVQDTADSIGVLPRDLEIMLLYVYSDFNPRIAIDTHSTSEGENLIAQACVHLVSQDGQKILLASNLIYRLRESEMPEAEAKEMTGTLLAIVESMYHGSPYFPSFMNETNRLLHVHSKGG